MTRRSNPAREESGASMSGAPGYHGSAQGEAVPAMGGEERIVRDPRAVATIAATCRECLDTGTVYQKHDEGPSEAMACDCPAGTKAGDAKIGADADALLPPAIVPPDPAALTAAVAGLLEQRDAGVADRAETVERHAHEIDIIDRTCATIASDLSRACDAKARSMAPGSLCSIGGVVYRSVVPRKGRGKPEDPGALWRLERVDVGT